MPAVAVIGHAVRAAHGHNDNVRPDHVANGRNVRGEGVTPAWQIPENNKSVQNGGMTKSETKQSRQWSAYRRWMSKNKVSQSFNLKPRPFCQKSNRFVNNVKVNLTASENISPYKYRETPIASVALYMGIGMFLVGLIITIVGVGENGFNTLELQLIGPCLTGLGILVCVIRVLVCCCADKCSYCDQVITNDGPRGTRTSTAGSDRSMPLENKLRLPSAQFDSGRKSVFRSVTPVPFNLSSGSTAVHGPSTSTGVCIEPQAKQDSWDDASSLDFDYNDTPTESPKTHKNELDNLSKLSSILSDDSADDNDNINEFREIELKKMSSPEPTVETFPTNSIDEMSSTKPQSATKIDNKNKMESAKGERKSTLEIRGKQNGMSTEVVLDPLQYLTRATIAASTKKI